MPFRAATSAIDDEEQRGLGHVLAPIPLITAVRTSASEAPLVFLRTPLGSVTIPPPLVSLLACRQ